MLSTPAVGVYGRSKGEEVPSAGTGAGDMAEYVWLTVRRKGEVGRRGEAG